MGGAPAMSEERREARLSAWVDRELRAVLQADDVAIVRAYVMGLVRGVGFSAASGRASAGNAPGGTAAQVRPRLVQASARLAQGATLYLYIAHKVSAAWVYRAQKDTVDSMASSVVYYTSIIVCLIISACQVRVEFDSGWFGMCRAGQMAGGANTRMQWQPSDRSCRNTQSISGMSSGWQLFFIVMQYHTAMQCRSHAY